MTDRWAVDLHVTARKLSHIDPLSRRCSRRPALTMHSIDNHHDKEAVEGDTDFDKCVVCAKDCDMVACELCGMVPYCSDECEETNSYARDPPEYDYFISTNVHHSMSHRDSCKFREKNLGLQKVCGICEKEFNDDGMVLETGEAAEKCKNRYMMFFLWKAELIRNTHREFPSSSTPTWSHRKGHTGVLTPNASIFIPKRRRSFVLFARSGHTAATSAELKTCKTTLLNP